MKNMYFIFHVYEDGKLLVKRNFVPIVVKDIIKALFQS